MKQSIGLLVASLCVWATGAASSPRENHVLTGKINAKSPASELPAEVDVLKLMNVSAKDQGVSLVEGPVKNYPAYKFRLPYENVPLVNSSAVTQAMSSDWGFTVLFLYRQQRNNLGTLLSVHSPGKLTPWFQINSNLKTKCLTLRYVLLGSHKVHQVDFKLPNLHRKSPLAAWIWAAVTLDVPLGTVRLDLDCHPSQFETLSNSSRKRRFAVPRDSLVYFRQEPGRKKKFLGSMQVAKILPYATEQRPWTCLQIVKNNRYKPVVK